MKGIFTQRKRRRRHHRASRTATGGKGDARLAAKPEARRCRHRPTATRRIPRPTRRNDVESRDRARLSCAPLFARRACTAGITLCYRAFHG
ncbi:MAG: hypothetical protein QOJ23_5117 [Actinomycetota bacterium]|nr:hypothetical protein [Actinomycetota bacterium]